MPQRKRAMSLGSEFIAKIAHALCNSTRADIPSALTCALQDEFRFGALDSGVSSVLHDVLIHAPGAMKLQSQEQIVAWINPLLGVCQVPNLKTGAYELRLASGRLVWEADLGASDLLFPSKTDHLALAADTNFQLQAPTRTEYVLGLELIVSVHKGIEGGSLRVDLPAP